MAGWDKKEGELKVEEGANLLGAIAHSLFHGQHTTTYKYAFLKSILDNLFSIDIDRSIPYQRLSRTFCETYWNLVAIYHLPQQVVSEKTGENAIEKLIRSMLSKYPMVREVRHEALNPKVREEYVSKGYQIFIRNVIGAFHGDTGGHIYGFSHQQRKITLSEASFAFLSDHKVMLEEINYYEWLKMTEKILEANGRNLANISTILEDVTKRSDLSFFKEELRRLADQRTCFYCGAPLNDNAPLDHVVPWSFIKQDELWNFVFACPSCNSSKSNRIPSSPYLKKLSHRNEELDIPSPDLERIVKIAVYNGVEPDWHPKRVRI